MKLNTMNPVADQTAASYCLTYRLHKNISRREEQTTQVMAD